VRTLRNESKSVVEEKLFNFFERRKANDTLLLYLSCHGRKDASGRLYFVMNNTKFDRLAPTGLASSYVRERLEWRPTSSTRPTPTCSSMRFASSVGWCGASRPVVRPAGPGSAIMAGRLGGG
jgi:hypothetical protein